MVWFVRTASVRSAPRRAALLARSGLARRDVFPACLARSLSQATWSSFPRTVPRSACTWVGGGTTREKGGLSRTGRGEAFKVRDFAVLRRREQFLSLLADTASPFSLGKGRLRGGDTPLLDFKKRLCVPKAVKSVVAIARNNKKDSDSIS
jgi:hypothetical protein